MKRDERARGLYFFIFFSWLLNISWRVFEYRCIYSKVGGESSWLFGTTRMFTASPALREHGVPESGVVFQGIFGAAACVGGSEP